MKTQVTQPIGHNHFAGPSEEDEERALFVRTLEANGQLARLNEPEPYSKNFTHVVTGFDRFGIALIKRIGMS